MTPISYHDDHLIIKRATSLTANATIHATAHCHSTTAIAHFLPSSLLIAAIAATHGVYSKLNTKRVMAVTVDKEFSTPSAKRTPKTDTTLSLAINPLIRDVHILQSPSPSGANTGAIIPAINASILSFESAIQQLLL